MKSDETVDIVFATNEAYAPYLAATISSILTNANPKNAYRVHVLYKTLSESRISLLERMQTGSLKIDFIDVSERVLGRNYYNGVRGETRHVSEETFYRLLIPELFPDARRVLYLDCDLILCADVAELFHMELDGNMVGAVIAAEYWNARRTDVFSSNDREFFNAGVMLFDIQKCIEYDFVGRCLKIGAEEQFASGDQDVLCLACFGKTKYLPYEWNFLWHHLTRRPFSLKGEAADVYRSVMKKPKIIHYSSGVKPWNKPDALLADYFWREAKKTPFYEIILYENLKMTGDTEVFGLYIFPFDCVRRGEQIALYGAGRVGTAFHEQIMTLRWGKLVAWADKAYNSVEGRKLGLVNPENLRRIPFDKIIIAVESEGVAKTIRKDLLEIGVPEKKIVWQNPFA